MIQEYLEKQLQEGVDNVVFPPLSIGGAPPPGKRSRRSHRRAVTEGSFDFFLNEEPQQTKTITAVSSSGDLLGLGPARPPKPDLLNSMAHSFVKEEQFRLLSASTSELDLGTAAITKEAHPPHQDGFGATSAPSPAALMEQVPPAPSLMSVVTPPSSTDENVLVMETIASEDAMDLDDMAAAIEPVVEEHAIGMGNADTTDMNMNPPSRLSVFLDSLQTMADQQNAVLLQQQQQQQQQPRSSWQPQMMNEARHSLTQMANLPSTTVTTTGRKHRRTVSEGPKKYDLQPWSFEMNMMDRTEDAAILGGIQAPAAAAPIFY